MPPQIVILTGMHRSGTSLIASLLQRGGVDIGRDLMEPDSRNKRGFFEDMGFVQFHERALLDRGTSPYVDTKFVFEATPAEREEALRLVAQRQGLPLWGWKDPRSSVFLDFWHEILPEARFLFVYRHPLEVLLSLVRRNEAHTVGLLEGLTAWVSYNSRILAFRQRHPGACFLCHTFTALSRPGDLASGIAARLGVQVSLDRSTVDSLYHREELIRLPRSRGVEAILREVQPEVMAIYEGLEKVADLASDPEPVAEGPELDSLSRAVACFDRPHPASRARGLLLLLLAALDADLLERYFLEHGRYVLHLEQDRSRLQSALDAEAMTVRRQGEWVGVVEENNRAKQAWIEKQDAAIASQNESIDNQKKWIDTVEENNRAKQEWIEALEADNQAKKQAIEAAHAELKQIHDSDAWRVGRRLSATPPGRFALRLLRRARREADKEPA